MKFNNEIFEKNVLLLIIGTLVAASWAGLAQIVPLFSQADITDPHPNLIPLSALEMEGRDIYIREGCHVCHTQMIRPLRGETERYGKYSVAGETAWEHPFLWGSKRTGPDLARVGGKYSDDWHYLHLINPRDVVPQSVMPAYPWLSKNTLDGKYTEKKLRTFRDKFNVPYTDEQIAHAKESVAGKTEMEALIAYLQQLGHAISPQALKAKKTREQQIEAEIEANQ